MVDPRTVFFHSLVALFVTCASVMAADLEYVSPQKQHDLEVQFAQAHFNADKDSARVRDHQWTCDMYGVRSRLQVQRGLRLYKWPTSSSTGSGAWYNKGAQIVSDYHPESAALVARNSRVQDEVKLTQNGELVSRLSLNTPQKTVLAYSVCKEM